MISANDILQELEMLGNPGTKRVFQNHGAPEPLFGVKVGDLKNIVKRIKKNHALALELYDTGNSDARYLAGLIADEKQISAAELRHWVEQANWHMLSEYTVAWVAAESAHGWELALEWIASDRELIAAAGWSTLASLCTIRPDSALDLPALERLLDQVAATIHTSPNRVRYAMNGFVIAAGSAVMPLTEKALAVARQVGEVQVNVGNTSCLVPDAEHYIQQAREKGRWGKKKKMARC